MNHRYEQGSALVLTLLFILLLSSMSAAVYLYGMKQSNVSSAQYSTVASSQVADAGVEYGKFLVATRDMALNTYGQNPDDNMVTRDDFPVILPMSAPFGQFSRGPDGERITDGRQGVGNYSVRIDGSFTGRIDFDLQVQRNPGIDLGDIRYGDLSKLNRILPGKAFQLQIRQGSEVINTFGYNYLQETILTDMVPGTMTYEMVVSNYINPFMGDPLILEFNRSDILTGNYTASPSDTLDAWGNPLILFPNEENVRNDTSFSPLAFEDITAKFFNPDIGNPNAVYLVHLYLLNPGTQNDVQFHVSYKDSTTGLSHTENLITPDAWDGTKTSAYILLDFSPGGAQSHWRQNDEHDLATGGLPGLNNHSIIFGVTGNVAPQGVHVTVSRAWSEVIDVGMKVRSEIMPDDCWYPDYPDCHVSGGYQHILTLPMTTAAMDHSHVSRDIRPELMQLEYTNIARVHELYTITSTGNVGDAVETRRLLASPVSFLDYARFTQLNLRVSGKARFGGKVYSQQNVELPWSGLVYFYDDLIASGRVINSENAVFPLKGQVYQKMPLIEIPPFQKISQHFNSYAANAWVIGTPYSNQHYDIFLGNYEHVKTEGSGEFWGFDFSGDSAVYRSPTVNIENSDAYSYRTGWIPGSLGPPTTTLPEDFNGLVMVHGNAHVWGKLHGRSLTIVSRGDIYIEREILMGTNQLDSDSPSGAVSTDQGLPVNLALIPLRHDGFGGYDGEIILSEFCPRILKVEAALMPFAGTIFPEDDDYTSSTGYADGIDHDNSHKYATVQWDPVNEWFEWIYSDTPPSSFDLDGDGRLSDARDYASHEFPSIDLGDWNEKQIRTGDYVWYYIQVGTFVDVNSITFGHFRERGEESAVPHPDDYRNGITRVWRYNPSMRINPPPFIPAPQSSLRLLEQDHARYN
jgi:hypothetical protein